MDESEASVGTQQIPQVSESLISPLDIFLVVVLIGVGYWLIQRKKGKEALAANGRSYSIQ